MGDLTQALRAIRNGAVARVLLAEILHLAEREGILERMRRLSPFSCEDLCQALQSDLGYALEKGNRRRMICLLLRLLCECGWVREGDRVWDWGSGDLSPGPVSAGGAIPATDLSVDDQYRFLHGCLKSVPAYIRGANPSVLFDEEHAAAWERFLGCAEFQTCRSVLLKLMRIQNEPAVRLLDLCHGPGWGLEAVISRVPAIRITALDFTEAFSRNARARAEQAQAQNRRLGHPVVPITWVGPDRWKGFGHVLPFSDGAFEAVLFSCGDPYIPHGLRAEVYREIARVLGPEGRLGILTRCSPDAGGQHVASHWLRISALAHDLAESVCEGWEGFSNAEENMRVFSDAGFRGGVPLLGSMSFLDSSFWVLRKRD